MKRKVLLVYNDKAGTFKPGYSRSTLCRLIEKEGYIVELIHPEKFAGVLPSLNSFRALIVAGGDGSVNSVVDQLIKNNIQEPPPLAVLPWGTVNDLYRQLYYKGSNFSDIMAVIREGSVSRLDIGQVNGSCFVNVLASGLFSDVSCLTPGFFKRLLGKSAYYLHALVRVFTYRPFHLKTELNGEGFEEEVYLFLVLNGSQVGGMFSPAPKVSLNSGSLHFLAIKKDLTFGQGFKILKCFLRGGTPDLPSTINFTAKSMNLIYSNNLPLVVDGEKGPQPPLEVKLIPARIPFFTDQI